MAGLQHPVPPPPVPEQGSLNNLSSLIDDNAKDCLLACDANFSGCTRIDCFSVHGGRVEWLPDRNQQQLKALAPECSRENKASTVRHVIIFATLVPDLSKKAKYKATSCLSRTSVEDLIDVFGMNTRFLPNLLGSPDYWAPRSIQRRDDNNDLLTADFVCQHPRWALQDTNAANKAPLSVYTHQHEPSKFCFTIVAGPAANSYVQELKKVLQQAAAILPSSPHKTLLDQPLEVQYLVSRIACESAKVDIAEFRSKMFPQLEEIDKLLSPEHERTRTDREALAAATFKLQEISKDVNKLIADADCAMRLQKAMLEAQEATTCTSTASSRDLVQSMAYLVDSMDKQKMWLHSYRVRKDIAMSLVFNLVTQRDAANNFQIARNMQRDGSSMKSIAMLTMFFLPGTFTATVLGAGLFSTAIAGSEHVSRMWQIWIYTTVPLTLVVVAVWLLYLSIRDRENFVPSSVGSSRWQWWNKRKRTDEENGKIAIETLVADKKRGTALYTPPWRRWKRRASLTVIDGEAVHAIEMKVTDSAGKGSQA